MKQIKSTKSGLVIFLVALAVILFIYGYVVYTSSPIHTEQKAIEAFETDLKLQPFNDVNPTCKRDLSFSKFVDAVFKASDRATISSYKSKGTCPIDMSKPYLSPDMSVVEENTFSYVLKSFCILMNYKAFNITPNADQVQIVFRNNQNSLDDSVNLLYFFLLNPVYIEFETSDAYSPAYDISSRTKMSMKSFYLTNYRGGQILQDSPDEDVVVSFKRLVPPNVNIANPTFNYKLNNATIPELTTIIDTPQNGSVNVKVYFLDDQCPPTAGRSVYIPYSATNRVGTVKIFNKNYTNDMEVYMDSFYFNQKIFILLQNSKFPVMTFDFEINVTKTKLQNQGSNLVEVYRVYMDTDIGKYSFPQTWVKPMDTVNNMNVLSCLVQSYGSSYNNFLLRFVTGANQDNKELLFQNAMVVELPFAEVHERINVTVTVTPTEKITLCRWTINGNDMYVFKRMADCSTNNHFARLFNQSQGAVKKIGDMYVKYDTQFVTNTFNARLGYMNYLDKYLN